MYYDDDIFHPNNLEDDNLDDDIYTIESTYLSLNSHKSGGRKTTKKLLEDAKNTDKGFYSFDTKVGEKRIKIIAYDSGYVIGNKIRDPITGIRQNYMIGSADEDLFFKVRIAGSKKETPITLFYDSPEHYERHLKTTLADVVKQKWNNKMIIVKKTGLESVRDPTPENIVIR